jgi:hypothetical protein
MAITSSARKALADRSVSLVVASNAGAAETISNAELQASATSGTEASAYEKKQKAIYADFLNASYANLAALRDAVASKGVVTDVVGANVGASLVSWNVAANKAVLNFTSAAAGDFVVRISLASSIAS